MIKNSIKYQRLNFMRTIQRILLLGTLTAFMAVINLNAQVAIGNEEAPQPFSLLEIMTVNQDGGLRLPQLTTAERDALDLSSNPDKAKGLLIYNKDNDCLEYWNLTKWVSLCNGDADEPIDPTTLPSGSGSLRGKICFDIAETNDNLNGCAALSNRIPYRANFNDPVTKNQVYSFTPPGTVSYVRFAYVESQPGMIVDSLTPDDPSYESLTNISNNCTVTLTYKSSLSSPDPDDPTTATALGLTTAQALTVDIYAIYNNNADGTGTDHAVKLTVSIKDCVCCGAKTASGWLTFMCHNLGADESLDPFAWNSIANNRGDDIKGDLYQWGRPSDGHEKRNSARTSTLADSNIPGHGDFIYINNVAPNDWRSGGENNDRWGDGTTFGDNTNMIKAANDPCPEGWKIPSQKQWASIYTSASIPNTWTWTGNGYQVGHVLYLPAAGSRRYTNGGLRDVGLNGLYSSSTVNATYSSILRFTSSSVSTNYSTIPRAEGLSVRCVQEN